jgi:predicted nucleic acid-binding protein
MTHLVVDTSAILAAHDEGYEEHAKVAAALTGGEYLPVISPMVVAGADYMLFARLGRAAALRFARDVSTEAYELAEWTAADQAAALDIAREFGDDKDYIGMADAGNVVLADRYRTTTLLTLDQRHFRRLRPLWGADHFTLLPYDA